jgi:hypothetical protein
MVGCKLCTSPTAVSIASASPVVGVLRWEGLRQLSAQWSRAVKLIRRNSRQSSSCRRGRRWHILWLSRYLTDVRRPTDPLHSIRGFRWRNVAETHRHFRLILVRELLQVRQVLFGDVGWAAHPDAGCAGVDVRSVVAGGKLRGPERQLNWPV